MARFDVENLNLHYDKFHALKNVYMCTASVRDESKTLQATSATVPAV